MTPDEVKALAEKHYGKLKNTAEPPPRVRTAEPEPVAARRVAMQDPKVATPSVQRAYLAPAYATGSKSPAEALEVLAELLGGSTTSRHYRDLVVDQRWPRRPAPPTTATAATAASSWSTPRRCRAAALRLPRLR